MAGKIFVNYRRDDGAANAARLRDRLARVFGKSDIFMDVDNLLAGQRFDKELEKALSACDVFLAVIGPRWMELLKSRSDGEERDYVREEIAAALRRGIVVIPVLVERAVLPRGAEVPEDIREMVLHQKHDITHEHFGRDTEALIAAIKAGRKALRAVTDRTGQSVRLRAVVAGLVALLVGAGAVVAYHSGMPITWPLNVVSSFSGPRVGETFRDCNDGCPEMVVMPAGEFTMGSNDEDQEKPSHNVTIRTPFAASKFEVTSAAPTRAATALPSCTR